MARKHRQTQLKLSETSEEQEPLDARQALTRALLENLIDPGLIPACKILIHQMNADKDVASAKEIIKTAKELVQRGFPEPSAASRAERLRRELDDLQDGMAAEGGGGEEGPHRRPAAPHLGEGEPGLLPREEDL